jgi:3D (Asp-Asp-Asp) domain-containing protein
MALQYEIPGSGGFLLEKHMRKHIVLGLVIIAGILSPSTGTIFADSERASATLAFAPASVGTGPGLFPPTSPIAYKTFTVRITAYTSASEETDDTPFITASGRRTRDGIVASNFLPMYTRIRIPSLFGDKIFVVEDRMHPRMKNVVDVWMEGKSEALKFGWKNAKIEILDPIPDEKITLTMK